MADPLEFYFTSVSSMMTTQTEPNIFTRNFILAFLAQFAFGCVFHILIPTLPIYLSRMGSTEIEIGILIGIFFSSSLVLRPFIGRALLKTHEKTFMTAGAILFAITSVAYLFASPFWPILIIRIFQGIGFALFQTASITMIVNISSGTYRGRSLSYYYLAINLSGALGPPLGMFLVNQVGFTALFWTCLGLSLTSLSITHKLETRQIVPLQDSTSEGSFLLSRKAIPPSIVSSFSLFIWGALTAFFPLYATEVGVTNPGLFFTTMALMLILGRALGGRLLDLYSREKIILPCLTTYIISMGILAFSKTLPMFILVAVIWGIGHAFLLPSLTIYTLDRVGSSPGPAMGTFTAISDLGVSLGPVIMGLIIHTANYPTMFLCLALTGLINLSYFYFFVREKSPAT
jgi:MFS family permease